ncbi:MAG: hypothetical protein JRF33_17960 [Deltaproteobacteria bacterium]|nr:hypothetical protein [Deltaproteobacteria bacterium]
MALETVQSAEALANKLNDHAGSLVLGFFGDFSEASRKAQPAFEAFCKNPENQTTCLLVDVGKTKGLHNRYGVSTVPTVLLLDKDKVLAKMVGGQNEDSYRHHLLGQGVSPTQQGDKKVSFPRVVVYSSDSCPWCTRVKLYLRKRAVPFQDINVSRRPEEAAALQRKTGQTGVPQVQIGGQWVVGFDQPKIDRLLNLPPIKTE